MLKALELSGFKSFADRTHFDFPRGISVVVGPNGSGKSNIVDAVKWVLGSQSAKSLRGKEMTDVIFNGCASRGPMGAGEVTLTLDNADERLPVEAKEVHVTRRVYRSGEGEYLLNGQPCRLRDIRETLACTGITTEAYCIIEQGRVDALLQSSPRDRRVIFEEAAGISQFKAKKATAQRRMERVEQNLLRLSDIVDEVESRLRSVRSQAGKARRYRECAERLQQLRTEVGLVDWRTLTRQLTAKDSQLAELKQRATEQASHLEQAEAESRELESAIEIGIQNVRELELSASRVREEIAARQANAEYQKARRGELNTELERLVEQLTAMSARNETADNPYHDLAEQLQSAEAELATATAERGTHLESARQGEIELSEARQRLDTLRLQFAEIKQSTGSLREQHEKATAELRAMGEDADQKRRQIEQLESQRNNLTVELAQHRQAEEKATAAAYTHEATLRAAEQRLVHVRRELASADKQHRHLEARLTRTRERIAVLSELEQRLEGLADGVQEAIRTAEDDPARPFGEMRGIVADLIHVDVDSAPLVEMALGERTQFLVVSSCNRLLEHLARQRLAVGTRLGVLPLDVRGAGTVLDNVDLSAEPGVMGRADRFVETAPEFEALVRRLLGRTWLVDRLSTAIRLSQSTGRGLEFVTSDGELLASDGTLIIGPRQAAAGMLSRRSELRACHEQVAELDQRLARQAELHGRLDEERLAQERQVAASTVSYTEAAGKLAECRQYTAAGSVHLDRVTHEIDRIAQELKQVEERTSQLEQGLQDNGRHQLEAQRKSEELRAELEQSQQELARLQAAHSALQAAASAHQISTAKCEQRVEMLRQHLLQSERDVRQREQALAATRERIAEAEKLAADLEATMLANRQSLEELTLRKNEQAEHLARQVSENDGLRQRRSAIAERIRSERQQIVSTQGQVHKLEVAATRIRHERQTLYERMQDDYGIDLEEAAREAQEEGGARNKEAVANRESVEQEIAELRNQVNSIGAINLDALDELEQIEGRFEALSSQYRDLVDAKSSLERIIQRINIDSRQLFVSTLETIRGHFGELFRRLFGGGEADIIVDEAEDVLECGIEIVARPPGKEACSISLLSGGEKTLTCVALLLAVFRSKPSPFCILDEVDAALDEANIGRFIGVLREFLSFTQFVVVTHSKKTMSGADTLYGVTMEESGVSKRVSVRFEDVSEDGQIAPSALRRAA